ncbi:MAG: ParA family protein [Acidobacteria bacterium]|nr:ParA family protein [Acidobacteriota bacterium]
MKAVITLAGLLRSGKSMLASCLAAEFALRGHDTLLVDCDARADATAHFMPPEEVNSSVADALLCVPDARGRLTDETFSLGGVVSYTSVERLGLAPGHVRFALFERSAPASVMRLRSEVDDISPYFDYVVIDTPAALGLTLSACLLASTHIVVPVTPARETPEALACLSLLVEEVRAAHPPLGRPALVANLIGGVDDSCGWRLGGQVDGQNMTAFRTVITRREEIAACRARHLPVQLHAPGSAGAALFARLADEVLEAVDSSLPVTLPRPEP